MLLTWEEKMALLAACLGSVFCTLFLMLCKLCHWCPLHRHCPLRARYDEEAAITKPHKIPKIQGPEKHELMRHGSPRTQRVAPTVKTSLISGNKQGWTYDSEESVANGSINKPLRPRLSVLERTKKYSASSCASSPGASPPATGAMRSSSIFSFISGDSAAEEEFRAQLSYSLHYNAEEEKLSIYAKSANNLPPSLYGTASDTYLRILLLRNYKKGWGRKKSGASLIEITSSELNFDATDLKTQIIRRSLNPTFNEYFTVDLKEKDRRYAVIKLAVLRLEKDGRECLVGESHKSLYRVELKELTDFTDPLRPYRPELGEITVTLNYLPTAERLSVIIEKATNLVGPPADSVCPHLPNPFVKVSLLHRGKTLERQKTRIVNETKNPQFDETMTFDLPPAEIEKTSVMMVVSHHEPETGSLREPGRFKKRNGHVSRREGGGSADFSKLSTSRRRKSVGSYVDGSKLEEGGGMIYKAKSTGNIHSHSVILGRIGIGSHSEGDAQCQWNEMSANPRQPITYTHKLLC